MRTVNLSEDYRHEIVQLWNKHLHKTFPMREDLLSLNSFSDPNLCLEASRLVLNEAGAVVAFVLAKRWQEDLDLPIDRAQGFIQVLLVDEAYRKQGLGSSLLNHVEETFRAKDIEKISLGSDLWHYFPGLPVEIEEAAFWFEERGYERGGRVYDLINTYLAEGELSMPGARAAHYELLQAGDRAAFLKFLERCFPDRWFYEALKYFERGGTGREFVVLKKDREIKGFCRLNDGRSPFIAQNVYWAPLFSGELGGIGPLGIDPEERGQGYGLGIVEAGITVLRNRGIRRIVIDWTDLVDFYGKLGYKKWKGYYTYSKTLK